MATKKRKTWIEVAVQNGGFRQALKALDWADSWIHAKVALGHEPTVEEIADWWGFSRRSAFRSQAAFRECFPDLESPAAIYANNPGAIQRVERSVKTLEAIDAAKRSRQARRDERILDSGLLPS